MSAAPRQQPRIAVVIVNYRTAAMVIDHFEPLKRECADFSGAVVYIVDNASPNGDGEKLKAFAAGEPLIRFIQSTENGGFGAGNNIALKEALAASEPFDYILLLNPDAYPRAGALKTLADFMAAHPQAGVVGPRLEHEDGEPQVSAFRYFSPMSELDWSARTGFVSKLLKRWDVAPPHRDETRAVDWLSGAALFFRREVFEAVGLFDETYFLYFEETDLMLRARRAGWRSWFAPEARVVHHQGKSLEAARGAGAPRIAPEYWYRSRAHYFRKNHGVVGAFLADAAWMAGAGFYLVRVAFSPEERRAQIASIRRFATGGRSRGTEQG
ncbi:MAG: glycosyltransferase family 2 protein [Amphiplicatus sp.]